MQNVAVIQPRKKTDTTAGKLHPRNRHQGRYDFAQLIAASPALGQFVRTNPYGELSIDFANPFAVTALNQALLVSYYGLQQWDIPPDALCPSIPGRADYVHNLADLLASCNNGVVPITSTMLGLDIGTGAGCIYPLIGHGEYGWNFVASDINAASLANAQNILTANPALTGKVSLRRQTSPTHYFSGIVGADDWFDFSMCNPPFHESAEAAKEGSESKWRKLGKINQLQPALNFGGQAAELWCPGGEQAFIQGMIADSARFPTRCFWFSSLVSKAASLPGIYTALQRVNIGQVETLAMSQGQKKSRLVAWTFLSPTQRAAWRKLRW